jgi:hypothetical protein
LPPPPLFPSLTLLPPFPFWELVHLFRVYFSYLFSTGLGCSFHTFSTRFECRFVLTGPVTSSTSKSYYQSWTGNTQAPSKKSGEDPKPMFELMGSNFVSILDMFSNRIY